MSSHEVQDFLLQISGLLRMNLSFCREWHLRQIFAIACFCRALDDENLKFTHEKPSNRAPISRFSSQLTGNFTPRHFHVITIGRFALKIRFFKF
jgi:hypothetical protein